ncbi:L-serine ammonia-lyase, iron-sulfur-dependent, subunit alpha, partial [Bacillus sp. RHFS18]|nr:L-serine ammonia-lyase, iron-sulfur-dependent, subunit alpha [Bacillus sp. RHFS18]
MFRNVKELIEITQEKQIPISEVMITQEMEVTQKTREEIFQGMERNLSVMEAAVEKGLKGVTSQTGLTGGDAVKLQAYIQSGRSLSGNLILDAVSKA